MLSTLRNRALLRVVFVAQGALALGVAGCELIDWEEVVEGATRPGSRPRPEPHPCAAILCPVDTVCVEQDDACPADRPCPRTARCVPKAPPPEVPAACAAILCPVNTMCVARDVVCVKEPCPPMAECVPIQPPPGTNPCDAVRCGRGTHCEAKQVTCVRAPCPPIAECVPNR